MSNWTAADAAATAAQNAGTATWLELLTAIATWTLIIGAGYLAYLVLGATVLALSEHLWQRRNPDPGQRINLGERRDQRGGGQR